MVRLTGLYRCTELQQAILSVPTYDTWRAYQYTTYTGLLLDWYVSPVSSDLIDLIINMVNRKETDLC